MITEAETGANGVRLAHERHRALILMDIQLPGISGIEALQALRADPLCGTSRGESHSLGSIDLLPGTLDGASGKELGVNDLP